MHNPSCRRHDDTQDRAPPRVIGQRLKWLLEINLGWEFTYMNNEVHAIDLIAAGILDANGLHMVPE